MRKIVLIVVLFVSLCVTAQNYPSFGLDYTPSVAGVKLGEEYKYVLPKLDERFGEFNKNIEAGEVTYFDVEVGGINYKYAAFGFIHKAGKKILNHVRLYSWYEINEISEAKNKRDYIARIYKRKYSDMEERKDNKGFKYYVCYFNPFKEFFWIAIRLTKLKSEGGRYYYYVTTSYGPFCSEPTDDI